MGRYWVYILASGKNGTLYVGVTNDLPRRVYVHREGLAEGFSKTYGVTILVYMEAYDSILDARSREAQLKKWRRAPEDRAHRREQSRRGAISMMN